MPRQSNSADEWLEVLNQLETSLGSGARDAVLVTAGEKPYPGVQWLAPEHLGQMPAEFEARARRLLAGQLELIREIEDARRSASVHLAAVRNILSTQHTEHAVYLDVAG